MNIKCIRSFEYILSCSYVFVSVFIVNMLDISQFGFRYI